jgi:hypothetical protein
MLDLPMHPPTAQMRRPGDFVFNDKIIAFMTATKYELTLKSQR